MATQENTDRVMDLFGRLSRLFALMEGFSKDTTLSKLEILALESVYRAGEPIMSKLASDLGIGMSTATGIADRLVERKLASRKRNHGDRRVVRITLTEKGKRAVLAHQKQMVSAIEKMLSVLTKEEQEQFIRTWEKISQADLGPREG